MNLKRALNKRAICLNLQSSTKEGVIEELVDMLDRAGLLKDRDAALQAVLQREQQMSTGLENGIAIPHGRTSTTDSLVAAIGIHRQGVDFDAADGRKSTIFVMTLSPEARSGPQVQFLADTSRLLNDAHIRELVREAGSEEEVIALLSGGASR